MPELSREFLASLCAAPVDRSVVAEALGTKESVSLALSRYARGMTPPHVVERYTSVRDIQYGLRPALPGELPGLVTDAARRQRAT